MFSRVSYGNGFASLMERSFETGQESILCAALSRQARHAIAVWYPAATLGARAAGCEAILRRRDGHERKRESGDGDYGVRAARIPCDEESGPGARRYGAVPRGFRPEGRAAANPVRWPSSA